MCLTSCDPYLDDIFGEWSRPTGNNGNTKTTVAVKSVTLDQTTLTKAVGDDAVTLTATVDPSDASDKTVTWKSSDASIAAVDANGKVTFVAAGTATITATATNGTDDTADDKTATCEVTISAKKVNVESVKLDQPTLTATVGDAAVTLTATVTPDDATDKTVKWTSSNESVATVADGVVTFVAAGTATITATAPNGTDDTADDKTAECAVTVNAAAAKVTTAPTATTGTIAAGSTTALVTAGVADGGTMMYQATITNTKPTSTTGFSATVPKAEGRAAGTYYVWYYAKADATHVDSEISATGIAVTITAKPSATVTTVPMATTGTIAAGSTTALVTAGVADGGTMMYQATTTNTKPTTTTGFSATVPTAATLAAGTYYVWYYAKADATHVDSEIAATAIEVTVKASYLKWDDTKKELVATPMPDTYTPMTSSTTAWSAGTYVVEGNVIINGTITLNGNVDLIIKDGAKLTVNNYIDGSASKYNLSIYGQANQTGQLVVNCTDDDAIFNTTTLEVHSCQVKATTSCVDAAGFFAIEEFYVYGGSVDAENTGSGDGYGINMAGSGSMNIYIYGGDVKAVGKGSKYGITGIPSTVTVYGGKLWAECAGNKALDSSVTLAKDAGFTGKIETSGNGSSWTEYTTLPGKPTTRYVRAGY